LCDQGCIHASVTEGADICENRDQCLHLVASSGRYTHLDGSHRRVPYGCYKIGRVAAGNDVKFLTNDVTNDPRVHDHQWARQHNLVSFAGYRLLSTESKPIGVLALFSKKIITPYEDALFESIAISTAKVIQAKTVEESLLESEEKYRNLFTMPRWDWVVLESMTERFWSVTKKWPIFSATKQELNLSVGLSSQSITSIPVSGKK